MQRWLVAFVLSAIVLVVYAPIVLGGKTWDDARYHTEIAPPRIAAADAVLHGELPTWWEGSALGVPLLAEPSHGAAYPPTWLAATPRTLDLLAVLHVLWCALGVALLAKRLRASELGAVIAGVLVVTSGVIASAALRGALPALAHLPWLAIASIQLARARTRRRQARATILIAVLLGLVGLTGQPVAFADAVAIILLATTYAAPVAPRVRGRAVLTGIALVCGLALASLQWLPFVLTRGDSVGMQLPRLSMSAALDLVVPRASAGWFGALYLGVPVLVLAVIARPPLRIALVGVLLAISAFVMPGGDLQIAVLALLAAAYAGVGFDRVTQWVSRKLRLVVVAVALAPTVVALPMLLPTVDRSLVDEPPTWQKAAERSNVWPRRVFRPVMSFAAKQDVHDVTLADRVATLAGESAAKWGTGAARSEDPARPVMHDRVWAAAASVGGALFDRYGIALAILPASMAGGSGGAGFHELSRRGDWALVEFPASPTAALVYEWMFARDLETAVTRLFPPGAASGLSSGVIVLLGEGAQNQDEPGPAQPCKLLRWDAGAIDVECAAERDAYAVISSTAARGWTAQIDGRAAPWLVADVMRRAVPLTPGTHRIAWRYSAPGLYGAVALVVLGIAVLVALWLIYGRDSDARDRATDPERTDVN